jgi:hypothetical protein
MWTDLGWQSELKESLLKLSKIGCGVATKATTLRTMLASGGQFVAESLPGVEILRRKFPGAKVRSRVAAAGEA